MTTVELYMTLREKAKERDIENADRLCDKLLESEVTSGIYPINEYFITVPKGKKWIQEDYERDYGLSSLILIFFFTRTVAADLRRRRYGCTDCVKKIQKQTVADIPFVNGAVRCNRVFYIAYT